MFVLFFSIILLLKKIFEYVFYVVFGNILVELRFLTLELGN